MNKVVLFDWGGVILTRDNFGYHDAIVRTIQFFNDTISEEEAWFIYEESLEDENGIFISQQNDLTSRIKWTDRICRIGNMKLNFSSFSNKLIEGYRKTDFYQEVVLYAYSLKNRCKIGIFSDLIYESFPALSKQIDLDMFDCRFLSFETHHRKNDINYFSMIEKELGVSPSNILFIDDSFENVSNAIERGWRVCCATGLEFDKIKEEVELFLEGE